MTAIRVLVVDDEPLIADAHRAYTERIEGFEVVAVAHSARDAMAALRAGPVDLVLLDLNLPDKHGLEVARALRTAGSGTDVLAVTSARDIAMVRAAVALGVTHYLLKPFTFAAFRDKLDGYARYRSQLRDTGEVAAQHEIDRVLATLRGAPQDSLPKGLDARTLDLVLGALRAVTGPAGALRRRGRRQHRGVAGHRAPLPGAPGRGRPGRPQLPLRRPRPAGGRIPARLSRRVEISRAS
ncbi:response regulator [Actinoplanes sp. NPDC004185]